MIRSLLVAFSFLFSSYGIADECVQKPKPIIKSKVAPKKRLPVNPNKYSLGIVDTDSNPYSSSSPVTTQNVTVYYPSQQQKTKTLTRTQTIKSPSPKNHIGVLIGSFKTGLQKNVDGCCNTTYAQEYEIDLGVYYLRDFGGVDLGGFYTSKKNFGWIFGVNF